jgi:hypothetical protein
MSKLLVIECVSTLSDLILRSRAQRGVSKDSRQSGGGPILRDDRFAVSSG